ncbi:TPA: hypothetical protein ACWWCV_002677 [Enterococcus faecium]
MITQQKRNGVIKWLITLLSFIGMLSVIVIQNPVFVSASEKTEEQKPEVEELSYWTGWNSVPLVDLHLSNGTILEHVWQRGKTSSPFALGYNADDNFGTCLALETKEVPSEIPGQSVYKAPAKSMEYEFHRIMPDLSADDVRKLEYYMTLTLNESGDAVIHEFTFVNNSSKALSLRPTKQVDTAFITDDVPVLSRGPHRGLFIQNEYYGQTYRLDYITDVPNGPKGYSAGEYGMRFSDMIGKPSDEDDFNELVQNTILLPEGSTVLEDVDSGIFLSWGRVTVGPGETWTGRYDVGIRQSPSLTLTKNAVNTNGTNTFKPGDIIEYQLESQYIAPKDTPLEEGMIEDQLPPEVTAPSEIKLVNPSGETIDLNVADVYDPDNHAIKVELPVGEPHSTYELRYKVRITGQASGQTIINTATIKGVPSGETEISASATKEIEVETVTTKAPFVVLMNENGEYDGNDYTLTGMWGGDDSTWADLYYQIDNGSPVKFGSQVPHDEETNDFEHTIKKGIIDPSMDHKIMVYAIDDNGLISNMQFVNLTARKGELLLQSYPIDFSFGDNLKVPLKDTSYPVDYMNGDLIVSDTRSVGQTWSMTARVIKRLEGDAGSLGDALYFYKDGQEYQMKDGISIPVIQHETINDTPVNVSENWDSVDNGFRLKIPGHTINPGNYSGNIEWTLNDVPLNK